MAIGDLKIDSVLLSIADYVSNPTPHGDAALEAARYNLMDSMACALEALEHPSCTKLLGPVTPDMKVSRGARVPGTSFILDPIKAAFDISTMVRWLDLSDAWVSIQPSHPSDALGGILAAADYASRLRFASGKSPIVMAAVLDAIVRAHEVQGALSIQSFTEHGIDNVFLAKIASAAVAAKLLGGDHNEIIAATSLAFFEPSLCVHRYGSNTGPRKGWAGGDASSQGVRFAMMALAGEQGYPQVISHPQWGFSKTFFGGSELQLGSMTDVVIRGVTYKLHPVVIHVQSAMECALALYPKVKGRWQDIAEIRISTHEQVMLKVNKTGLLRNAADRDHSIQYPIAVMLLKGRLSAHDYEDEVAADPRIDVLRELMTVTEERQYTEASQDPRRGASPHSMEILFKDGSSTGRVEVQCPIGHASRRAEALPRLMAKFEYMINTRFNCARAAYIKGLLGDHARLEITPVQEFTDLLSAE